MSKHERDEEPLEAASRASWERWQKVSGLLTVGWDFLIEQRREDWRSVMAAGAEASARAALARRSARETPEVTRP